MASEAPLSRVFRTARVCTDLVLIFGNTLKQKDSWFILYWQPVLSCALDRHNVQNPGLRARSKSDLGNGGRSQRVTYQPAICCSDMRLLGTADDCVSTKKEPLNILAICYGIKFI